MDIIHTQTGKKSYQLVINKKDGPIIVTFIGLLEEFRETDLLMLDLYKMLMRDDAPRAINGCLPEEGGAWFYDQIVPYIEIQMLNEQYGG
ncbi:hypothetical protein [uncultured Methylobacterium sp.]|jgi:hypothetical protein|uniref:hypothetical protein n=1 Tax=uncultured Methylobacterium sp. TaxID=157278 RepID=UPI00261DB703|nr:hypothetical protein [uncultured Methylobacterium sp.]